MENPSIESIDFLCIFCGYSADETDAVLGGAPRLSD